MLHDLKVVELASVLAGPSVGQFFAELGAEVIKVENVKTGGDVTRTWRLTDEQTDDRSAYFCSCNWGKKSIAIDLQKKEGIEVVKKLARWADVIIASYKPGDAAKLGVAYDQLRAENPALVYGQVTGYGAENERVGYDAVVQAEAGFMDLNGEKGGLPTKMPVALVDVLAAHHLKEGLLVALLHRQKTGEGSLVEVSLIQAALTSLTNQATNWLVAGRLPQRQGSAHPNIAPYGDSFVTSDGKRILLAIGSDRQFHDLVQVLQLEDVIAADLFYTNSLRVANREKLNVILAEGIRLHTADVLMQNLNAKKIPAGVIQNVREAFLVPEAEEILLRYESIVGVRNFVGTISGWERSNAILPPPHFGEHTSEILTKLSRL